MKLINSLTILWGLLSSSVTVWAQNPVVQTHFTADPAPMVYNGRMYIYADRDEGPDYYVMNEWRVYSSADMVNWTDHGACMPLTTFKWASANSAWASQCIERNGKFYWYVCCTDASSNSNVIGVAVGDSPTGPFSDALGKPLISGGWGYIDPTPYIDDDGQAYLYWGNPGCFYVKLNEDMISYSGNVVELEQTVESFGGPKDGATHDDVVSGKYKDLYEEGPWFYKRNGKYYLLYAAGGVPEHIAYSMSDGPTGSWKYVGQIMPEQNTNSFTNHCGVMDFKGHSYFFYHTGWLPNGGGFTRSVSVEEFKYNADGTIPTINATHEGVSPIGTLNPYERVEAETMAWGVGLSTEQNSDRGVYVTSIDNGDSLKVREVDFGSTGAGTFTACMACNGAGGTVDVHLDSKSGTVIAALPVSYTGGTDAWKEFTTGVNGVTGKHDVWFVFHGTDSSDLFKMDYWKFAEKKSAKTLAALNCTTDNYKIDKIAANGNTATMKVMAVYADGETEDVTSKAQISAADASKLSVSGATVTGLAYGETSVNISYGGLTTTQSIRVRSYNDENTVKSVAFSVAGKDTNSVSMMPEASKTYAITATYDDGRTVDITSKANITYSAKGVAQLDNGKLTAIADGETDISASYQGTLGDAKTATLHVSVQTIPLDAFDPTIWGKGTYNTATHTYQPAAWGDFGGWYYQKAQDWSKYRYLTVELESAPDYDLRFQLWDSDSYFDKHFSLKVQGKSTFSIDLQAMTQEDSTSVTVSPSHVYRIGFWSTLAKAVTIKSIRLEYPGSDERFSLDGLNPSIWGTGTYDKSTHTLTTGQYGFGGWEFSPALDLSDYDNIVVVLSEKQNCGAQFRFWDEDGYFASSANYEFLDQTTLKIDLKTLKKDGATTCVDPSKITRMGFWSYGGNPISISRIYLLKNSTGVNAISAVDKNVDVYNLAGVRVRSNVSYSDSVEGLPKGIYIINNKKVIAK
jgi:arabinoxylan arabinofuranohydrolase